MEEFDLQPGERVIRVVRQHWFVLLFTLIPFVLLAFVPTILSFLFSIIGTMGSTAIAPGAGANPAIPSLSSDTVQLLTGFYLLFLWIAAFSALTRYILTQWVITNTRIVDIKQRSLFSRNVSSFMLARIQDVTTDVSGLLPTLIGFGKIKVQTAGQNEDFILQDVPHPQDTRDLILDQVAILQHEQTMPDTTGL